jgi:two-component system response regulator AtoC
MLNQFVFGRHERMKDIERRIEFIARSGLPVLIEGASGTGKEALALLLHDLSGVGARLTKIICRKSGAVAYSMNGAANLSEVYTSAGGTLFLKNVHLLSLMDQEQLLAALEQAAEANDGKSQSAAATRLVSSTTESLNSPIVRSELNPALYHRLSVYRLSLPPLRERHEDIPEMFDRMVQSVVNSHGSPPALTAQLVSALIAYDWPGNLLELQNMARTYVVTGNAEEIIAELNNRTQQTTAVSRVQRDSRSLKEQVKGASQRLESEIIMQTLERHHWNRRRAAESLQISYRSLLYKMKTCNLRLQVQTAQEGK